MSDTLAGSRSPFLQHGAKQPVRWLPWGERAFERARREDKPLLLDIGAVWCHWCHVMDRESYEDPQTASLINEWFVPVKVDRDERPDVDARYQRAVQTLTGQGGWPLTAFLTPEGDAFYGGTYFPPTDQYGRPSFRRVLAEVARIWNEERTRAQDAVQGIRERLQTYAQAEVQSGTVSAQLTTDTIEEFAQNFDFRFGGFGTAPKFPNPGGLALLLDHHLDTGTDWSRRMVVETLDAMARGGIYDQLGGGFHRYSTDARWIIPHFEKMAYDNGPLLGVYARAYAATQEPLYRRICNGIVAYYENVASELLATGGFPASQDADYSPDDDGDYWTWTSTELQQTLSDEQEARAALLYFGLEDAVGAMHLDPQRHVLYQAMTFDALGGRLSLHGAAAQALIEGATIKLKAARDQRPRPYVDATVYTGWSALVASGCAAAFRYAQNTRALDHAQRALDRIWREAFDEAAGVAHRVGDRAAGEYLDDQAYAAQALLDLYEVTADSELLERTRKLVDVCLRRFQDTTGALRDRPQDATTSVSLLSEPHYPIADSPTPAGNAVLALVCARLAALLRGSDYQQRAEQIVQAFAGSAARFGTAAATFVRASAWLTQPVTTVVVVDADVALDSALWRAALGTYRPRTVLRYFQAQTVAPEQLPPELRAMVTRETPRAYLCAGRTCAAPVSDAKALSDLLREFKAS